MISRLEYVDKIINLIKQRPAIYDFNLREHRDPEYIKKLWNEIALELDTPVTVCKKKWLSLRTAFSRSLKNQSQLNLDTESKKKEWYLAGDLEFLKKFMVNYKKTTKKINAVKPFQNQYDNLSEDANSSLSFSTSHSYQKIPPKKIIAGKLLENKYDCSTNDANEFMHFSTLNNDQLNSSRKSNAVQQCEKNYDSPNNYTTASSTLTIKPEHDSTEETDDCIIIDSFPSQTADIEATQSDAKTQTQLANELKDNLQAYPDIQMSDQEKKKFEFEDQTMTFFKSCLPDIVKLSAKNQRLFKQDVLSRLNKSLDEQEIESI